MALPSNISYGEIRGRFLRAVQDGPDVDRYPEGVPIPNVRVDIAPDVSRVRDGSAVPPTAVYLSTVTLVSDSNGVLVDSQGNEGVFLVAGDSPNIEPSGWTYKASISAPNIVPHSFHFFLPADGVVDLSLVVPVAADPGAELEAWLQAVAQAQAAVGEAQQQVVLAALEADRSSDEADRAEAAADSIDTALIEAEIDSLGSRVTTAEGNVSSLNSSVSGLTTSVAGKVGITDVTSGQLYSRSGSAVAGQAFSSAATANTIAQRGTGGVLAVGEPTGTGHAATKGYVDLRNISLIDVAQFGAVGNGTTDDTAALQSAINAEVPLYWGNRTYRITSGLSRTLTGDLAWRSDGARIVLDRTTTIARAVAIEVAGYNVNISGPLTLNCQKRAQDGWYFNSGSGAFGTFSAIGLGVSDVHLDTKNTSGGNAITVRGGFVSVYFERPDIRRVTMASGVGEFDVTSICGLFIASAGGARPPGEITILSPYIENVLSEDLSYQLDQDAIKIFAVRDTSTAGLSETHFLISGGVIKNPGGRSVKSQTEWGVVENLKIERNSTVLGTAQRTMPEIDFQVGGGTIRDLDVNYNASVPSRVVNWSGTRQVGGANSLGLVLDGLKISVPNGSSANQLVNVITLNMQEQLWASHRISNVEHALRLNFISGDFCTITGLATAEAIVNIDQVTVPLSTTSAFLYRRNPAAMVVFASISNVVNRRPNSSLFSRVESGSAMSVSTYGQNVRVA